MSDIKVGDYVECVKSAIGYDDIFTVGEKYLVAGVLGDSYLIVDNDGEHDYMHLPLNGSVWSFKKAES